MRNNGWDKERDKNLGINGIKGWNYGVGRTVIRDGLEAGQGVFAYKNKQIL